MAPPRAPRRRSVAACAAAALLAACGGGSGDTTTPPAGSDTAARAVAADATATSDTNPCAAIRPFYWEIGDASAALASGSVGGTAYVATTPMAIASASKWLYSAYVAQKKDGVLDATDIDFLTFRSGYTSFSFCLPAQTVDGCLAYLSNGVHTPANDGKFFYDGGHMQKHASLIGLGALDNASLAAEIRSQLGSDVALAYSQPQIAGGAIASADDYARFLRKLLAGTLALGAQLGTQAVCTNPTTCAQALSTPIPLSEQWRYSLGHWVESDPTVGDGAFSSPGAFGFYPWIDAAKTTYGIVARRDTLGAAIDSVQCGRLIRKAWMTKAVQ